MTKGRIVRRLSDLKGEIDFLSGRHSPFKETIRVFRIMVEFIRGFRAFHRLGPAITVFGSARFDSRYPAWDLAYRIGHGLALQGYTVVTGGGPGIMEAASRGAYDAGGTTIGANIIVPQEQAPNPFLTKVVNFYYFFVRKVMLIKYSFAYVILPGGYGTLDEFMEAVTLIQTGKIYDFPVILVGRDYWQGLLDWLKKRPLAHGAVDHASLALITLTDDPAEVLRITARLAQRLKLPLSPRTPTRPQDKGNRQGQNNPIKPKGQITRLPHQPQ